MPNSQFYRSTALALALLAAQASASAHGMDHEMASPGMSMVHTTEHREASGEEAAYLKENDAAMDKMMAVMEVEPSGDIDRDFVEMMVPHH